MYLTNAKKNYEQIKPTKMQDNYVEVFVNP